MPDLVPHPWVWHKVEQPCAGGRVAHKVKQPCARGRVAHKDAQGTHKGAHKVHLNLVEEVVTHKVTRGARDRKAHKVAQGLPS